MNIEVIVNGTLKENCYILYNSNECLIIDPGSEINKIDSFINKNKLKVLSILITHYHLDHTLILDELINKYNVNVIDYKSDEYVNISSFSFKVVKCFGHTLDSCYFLFDKYIFTGDFLFKGTIGNYENDNLMNNSLSKLFTLETSLIVYPGHGENTTIKEELINNPFLNRTKIASILVEYPVKTLNKVFDYIVPFNMFIRVGNKVIVNFNKSEVEGFVLNIHFNYDKRIEYKSIIKVVDDFYLNDELLLLGKSLSKSLVCNLISCYQTMLPRALKAHAKTNINKKYITKVYINKDINIEEYKNNNKRKKSQLNIIDSILNGNNLKKDYIPLINNLIKDKVVYEVKEEIYREVNIEEESYKDIKLTNNQIDAFNSIKDGNNDKYLLYGVTGSGKTEVYISLIKDALSKNKSSIVLVPEISLTPQIVSRFKSVFKESIAIFHSALSEGEKYDEYRRIMNKEVKVVVGARSAIFMPLSNIGYIIIDECQSTSYKQDNNPKYNAIDVAFERCKYHKAKVVLGSATPTLEQYARGLKGVFKLVKLDKRISNNFPSFEIVDMNKEAKKHNYIISSILDKEIKRALSNNNQVILLLNRRGFSTFLSCQNCGYVYKCPNCDISLTYHKSSNSYTCHYCGYRIISDKECPSCHEESIRDLGLGTEKLEEMLINKYNVPVLRMDTDTTNYKNAHQKLIKEFSLGKYKILVGTQMISKGLNFENATLVGIINADASLALPDFRACEKTYELLSQTSGRVGRYDLPGKVIIQTYNSDNYVFECVIKNDYDLFFKKEMLIRKKLGYPPYYYVTNITVSSKNYNDASDYCTKIKNYLDNNLNNNFIILGPSMANIFKLNNLYHFNIMIKYKNIDNLLDILNNLYEVFNISGVKIDISINI